MTLPLAHRTRKQLNPGKFYPRGAVPRDGGVNFAVYSRYAEDIFLILFDEPDGEPTDIILMESTTRNIRHVFVHGIGPGQLYAFRARGSYDPSRGMRFNPSKLLVSPYSKSITGPIRDEDGLLFAYDTKGIHGDLIPDTRDNMHLMPKSVVIDDHAFDWEGDIPPDIPYDELVIYEAHLKGFTAHPSSGVKSPGTYLGFIEKIPYLKELGINAVEFLPLQQFYVEDFLLNNGLT
ncbi:MAG TPA: glycogen debranching enzyme GlgX, partial [Verrucomicrobiae bacterium]|nr:glycogen debranching enzyme GlgX [Verrucomicrobiae bacterium]